MPKVECPFHFSTISLGRVLIGVAGKYGFLITKTKKQEKLIILLIPGSYKIYFHIKIYRGILITGSAKGPAK